MRMVSELIGGVFVKELKNRFLCEVLIDNEETICYVPSSCHLSNFLNLEGKKVLLIKNTGRNTRTEYALFAVPYKRNYILLNTSAANEAIENTLMSKKFGYLGFRSDYIREHNVEGYKCDFFLPNSRTIIEAKSVLSLNKNAVFPTVYSERTIDQLVELSSLLLRGYKVVFYIASLHPYVDCIYIDTKTVFYKQLKQCIDNGLILKACTVRTEGFTCKIDKHIPVVIEEE